MRQGPVRERGLRRLQLGRGPIERAPRSQRRGQEGFALGEQRLAQPQEATVGQTGIAQHEPVEGFDQRLGIAHAGERPGQLTEARVFDFEVFLPELRAHQANQRAQLLALLANAVNRARSRLAVQLRERPDQFPPQSG